jgi:hypothetical protein
MTTTRTKKLTKRYISRMNVRKKSLYKDGYKDDDYRYIINELEFLQMAKNVLDNLTSKPYTATLGSGLNLPSPHKFLVDCLDERIDVIINHLKGGKNKVM